MRSQMFLLRSRAFLCKGEMRGAVISAALSDALESYRESWYNGMRKAVGERAARVLLGLQQAV
jgi:hypothetical protein